MNRLQQIGMGLLALGMGPTLSAWGEPSLPLSSASAAALTTWQSLTQIAENYHCSLHLTNSLSPNPHASNRYEMAALLATCLEHLGDRTLDPQDRTVLQSLRSEFKLELAALQGDRMTTAAWPNGSSARLSSVTIDATPGTGLGTPADNVNLDLAPIHWLRPSNASPSDTTRSITQSLSWQVAEGNVRLRGIVLSPEASRQESNVPCNFGPCSSFGRSDPYHTLTTLEYTQSLGDQLHNRVALGLHYASNDLNQLKKSQVGINAEATFGKIGVFGQASLDLTHRTHRPDASLGDHTMPLWVAGVGIRDFIVPQSVLTVSAGQAESLGSDLQSAPINYGAFYQFPIGERLTLSPSVVIMANPTNPGAAAQIQGALQASFSF